MAFKKRPWNKADKKAAKMPPLRHTVDGKFSPNTSEVIQWLTSQPEILNWLFDTMRTHKVIEFDAEDGVWVGVQYGS